MDGLMEWGLRVIAWFQQFSPALDWPFRAFTFMGEEEFFLLLLPLVYWCLDRRTGARLTVAFLLCAYTNAVAKALAASWVTFWLVMFSLLAVESLMKLIIASRKFTKAKIRNMVQAKMGTLRKPIVNPPKL